MSDGYDLLVNAAKTVRERGKVYGSMHTNMLRTAQMWSAILGYTITPAQVAMCMIALKMARLTQTPDHEDSVVDIAGYAAVLRECQK
jgi:hypothetical protein